MPDLKPEHSTDTLYAKAMAFLGRPIKKSDDPDAEGGERKDDRVEGASPDEDQLKAAGAEAAAGGAAADPGAGDGGEQPGVPPDPGAGEGEGGGEGGEGGEGAGDYDDMSPEAVRDLQKAFGLTQIDEPEEAAKSANIVKLLESILSEIKSANAFKEAIGEQMMALREEHAAGHGKLEGVLRETKKALDAAQAIGADTKQLHTELMGRITDLPRTAPAAEPRAFTKAQPAPEPSAADRPMGSDELFQLALSGKCSASEIAAINRKINATTR
jgi:hypothetical protein